MADQVLVLLLEDDEVDAELITRALAKALPGVQVDHARTSKEYLERLATGGFDAIVSDSSVLGCEGMTAFHLARESHPHVPFIYLSGAEVRTRDERGLAGLGVSGILTKSRLSELPPLVQDRVNEHRQETASPGPLAWEHLAGVVRELMLARNLPAIMAVVRRAARELTGADGSSFVLREGDICHYADEDAAAPLWKGQRFAVNGCLAGWTMLNRQPAVIENIHEDARTPAALYGPTFVRSAVMVPIRALAPSGAIGVYWSRQGAPAAHVVAVLQALADATAAAMENARLHETLETRANERAAEHDALTYAVSHDLRAPIRHAGAFAAMILEDHGAALDAEAKKKLQIVIDAVGNMSSMVDGLLELSHMARAQVKRQPLDLAAMAREIAEQCKRDAKHPVDFVAPATLPAAADRILMRAALHSLLGNAWKFTSKRDAPRVEFGVQGESGRETVYFVRDNGAGFDDGAAGKLFRVFQRLHTQGEFPGTGVGLASAHRIIEKHGGSIWAAAKPGEGATFYFTLGSQGQGEMKRKE